MANSAVDVILTQKNSVSHSNQLQRVWLLDTPRPYSKRLFSFLATAATAQIFGSDVVVFPVKAKKVLNYVLYTGLLLSEFSATLN